MAVPVYSRHFWTSHDATSGPALFPDTSSVFVVRQIQVYNGNSLSFDLAWVLEETTTSTILMTFTWTIDEVAQKYWEGRIVIEPGFGMAWFTTSVEGASGVDVHVAGYQLLLP